MRAVVRDILARRMPGPPEEFAAIQISRLNEALPVAFSAMSPTNLKAVDRVVRIVRELDRDRGFWVAQQDLIEPDGLEAPVEGAAVNLFGSYDRPENQAQSLENIDSAPGTASASLAPLRRGEGWPPDLIRGEGPGRPAADGRGSPSPSS